MLKELKPPPNSPITCSINEGSRQLGVGRTMFYELVRAGEIVTTKIGRRRLPVVQSIYDYLNRQLASQGDRDQPGAGRERQSSRDLGRSGGSARRSGSSTALSPVRIPKC